MAHWRKFLPYKALRPEERLSLDLYRAAVQGKEPGFEAWREGTKKKPASYTSVSSGRPHALFGGSPNFELAALAVRATQGEARLEHWRKLNDLFKTNGHMLAELSSSNYGDRHSISLAVTVANLQDPNHPSAEILRRQLLMFAVMARPIVAKDNRGKVLYEGYGWRPAGLRSLPIHWDAWKESYLLASILGLDAEVTALGRKQEREWYELVLAVVGRASNCFAVQSLYNAVADLADADNAVALAATGYWSGLHALAAPLRSPPGMSAVYARDVETGETFSCLLGRRVGNNTAATWAVLAWGPALSNSEHCYVWRDGSGAPIKRVRRGKLKKAGGVVGVIGNAWFEGPPSGDRFGVGNTNRKVAGQVMDLPSWLYDNTRSIRLEIYHDRDAVLNLPGGG